MRMTRAELDKSLELHQKWLDNSPEGRRLHLHDIDLHDVNLPDTNLISADFYGTNLSGVNFYGTNLSNANLYDTNLSSADLKGANLYGTVLYGVNLDGADLRWVNWHEAKGLKVYEAQLNSSRENAQLVYIPSLDVATTGCWQGSWKDTKERVDKVYKNTDAAIYKKYQLAFKYIEEQIDADRKS